MNNLKKKISFLSVLFFLLNIISYAFCITDEEHHEYMDTVMEQLGKNNIPAATELLSQILRLYPDSLDALKLRAPLLLLIGKGEAALEDVEKILSLEPGNTEFILNRCTFRESMGQSHEQLLQCYSTAIATMKKMYPQEYLCNSQDYVIAGIFAETQEIEQIKKDFLSCAKSDNDRKNREAILIFDRKNIISIYDSWNNSMPNISQ